MAGTAEDFLRLLEALRQGGGAILPDELIAEMARDRAENLELPNAPGCGFGLGFRFCAIGRWPLRLNQKAPGAGEAPTATRGSWIGRAG